MKFCSAWLCVAVVTIACASAEAQNRQNNFFNTGVALYNPVIDVVNSGPQVFVRPSVSADRKHVTIGGTVGVSQLIELRTFPVAGGVFGLVGTAGRQAGVGGDNAGQMGNGPLERAGMMLLVLRE